MVQPKKMAWKGKEFKKWLEAHFQEPLKKSGEMVAGEVRRGIARPGRGRTYFIRGRRHRASKAGKPMKSPTGLLLNGIRWEVGRIKRGLGVRVGIGGKASKFAALARLMELGRAARVDGQRPTLRPALRKQWPKIKKMLTHLKKAQ